jgi:chromosome segregation ATPase
MMVTSAWHSAGSCTSSLPLAIVLAITLTGCQCTTGDPRAGGLFCWSRDQAETRQDRLRSQVASASATAAAEQIRSSELQTQKQTEEAETQALTARLNKLTQENQALEQQVNDLRRQQKQSSTKLQSMLHELDARKLSQTDAAISSNQAVRRQRADDIDQRNAQLKEAILFLLKR